MRIPKVPYLHLCRFDPRSLRILAGQSPVTRLVHAAALVPNRA